MSCKCGSRQEADRWHSAYCGEEKRRKEAEATAEHWKERFSKLEIKRASCCDEYEQAAALHSDLNRRAAEALGKPIEGECSTWSDIPESITELKAELDEMTMQRDEFCDRWEEVVKLLGMHLDVFPTDVFDVILELREYARQVPKPEVK